MAGEPRKIDVYTLVAGRIRDERRRIGWTLEKLAAVAGISTGFLAYIEQAKKKPSLMTAQRIADALGLSLAELFQSERVPGSDGGRIAHQLKDIIGAASPRKKSLMLQVIKTIAQSG
ncbi:MAG: helix-turn-helix transcriptional regulator [Elusimicrobia bacterium]|nr:helix-turn-helix transcriptional regulator [Elusimicrobiota bacterium]